MKEEEKWVNYEASIKGNKHRNYNNLKDTDYQVYLCTTYYVLSIFEDKVSVTAEGFMLNSN